MGAYVKTTWETASYDVWGNARDGYEVNNTFRGAEVDINCPIVRSNVGTPQEFASAYPSDKQIREALGCPRIAIETDGDDRNIYIKRARDGYPIGELRVRQYVFNDITY